MVAFCEGDSLMNDEVWGGRKLFMQEFDEGF